MTAHQLNIVTVPTQHFSKNKKVFGKCKCGSTSHKHKRKGVILKDEVDYNPKLVPTSGKSVDQLPPANDQLVVKDEAVNLKDDPDPKLVPLQWPLQGTTLQQKEFTK